MAKRQILVNMDEELIDAIDAITEPGQRSAWIGAACQDALGNGRPLSPLAAPAPSPADDDAHVWRAVAETLYELWIATQPGKAHDITPIDDYVDLGTYMAQHNGGGRSHA